MHLLRKPDTSERQIWCRVRNRRKRQKWLRVIGVPLFKMWSDDDKFFILYLRQMCLVIDRHLPPWIHILRWIFPRSAFWRIAFASVMLLTGALIPAMYWFTVIVVAVVAVGIGDLVGYQPPNALNRLELLFDLPTPSCIVAELECLLRHESEDTLDRLHRSVYAWRPWAIISKDVIYNETDACIIRGDDLDLRQLYNVTLY